MNYYADHPELMKQIKLSFGEYLEQRNYSEEAGFLYNAAGEISKGLEAFKKALNVDMCFSSAY